MFIDMFCWCSSLENVMYSKKKNTITIQWLSLKTHYYEVPLQLYILDKYFNVIIAFYTIRSRFVIASKSMLIISHKDVS